MIVTPLFATTSLKLYEEYEVISEVKTLNKTYYKIKTQTGEMFVRSENLIKVKDTVSVESEGHLYVFGDETIQVSSLHNVNPFPFKRIKGKDDE